MKGQLYICGENCGNGTDKYITIILIAGVLKGGPHKGMYDARWVASGSNITMLDKFTMKYSKGPGFGPYPQFGQAVPLGFLDDRPIYSSRWTKEDHWYPIAVTDLPRFINLPKKTILFDKILRGDYKRI